MSVTAPPLEQPASGHTSRRLETRRRLLEAGTQMFAELGLGEVTSTSIAHRAGVATGTFYLHFTDKHALFEVLVDEALDEIRAQFQPDQLAPRSVEAGRREIEGMVEVVERRRDLVRAVFDQGENSRLAERIQDRIAARLEPVYADLFPERNIGLHPALAAQARAAMLVRVIAWWAEDPSRADSADLVDILLELDPLWMAR